MVRTLTALSDPLISQSPCRPEGTGTLRLRSTVHDPLDDIEVCELRGASYIEGDLLSTCRPLARLPAEEFVPYLYGRLDDWSALDTENR